MVGDVSDAGDLVDPVRVVAVVVVPVRIIGIIIELAVEGRVQGCSDAVGKSLRDQRGILITAEQGQRSRYQRGGTLEGIIHRRLSDGTALSVDDQYTVGGPGSPDRRSSCILEDGDVEDVRRGDVQQLCITLLVSRPEVEVTRDLCIIRHPVEYDHRNAGGVDG